MSKPSLLGHTQQQSYTKLYGLRTERSNDYPCGINQTMQTHFHKQAPHGEYNKTPKRRDGSTNKKGHVPTLQTTNRNKNVSPMSYFNLPGYQTPSMLLSGKTSPKNNISPARSNDSLGKILSHYNTLNSTQQYSKNVQIMKNNLSGKNNQAQAEKERKQRMHQTTSSNMFQTLGSLKHATNFLSPQQTHRVVNVKITTQNNANKVEAKIAGTQRLLGSGGLTSPPVSNVHAGLSRNYRQKPRAAQPQRTSQNAYHQTAEPAKYFKTNESNNYAKQNTVPGGFSQTQISSHGGSPVPGYFSQIFENKQQAAGPRHTSKSRLSCMPPGQSRSKRDAKNFKEVNNTLNSSKSSTFGPHMKNSRNQLKYNGQLSSPVRVFGNANPKKSLIPNAILSLNDSQDNGSQSKRSTQVHAHSYMQDFAGGGGRNVSFNQGIGGTSTLASVQTARKRQTPLRKQQPTQQQIATVRKPLLPPQSARLAQGKPSLSSKLNKSNTTKHIVDPIKKKKIMEQYRMQQQEKHLHDFLPNEGSSIDNKDLNVNRYCRPSSRSSAARKAQAQFQRKSSKVSTGQYPSGQTTKLGYASTTKGGMGTINKALNKYKYECHLQNYAMVHSNSQELQRPQNIIERNRDIEVLATDQSQHRRHQAENVSPSQNAITSMQSTRTVGFDKYYSDVKNERVAKPQQQINRLKSYSPRINMKELNRQERSINSSVEQMRGINNLRDNHLILSPSSAGSQASTPMPVDLNPAKSQIIAQGRQRPSVNQGSNHGSKVLSTQRGGKGTATRNLTHAHGLSGVASDFISQFQQSKESVSAETFSFSPRLMTKFNKKQQEKENQKLKMMEILGTQGESQCHPKIQELIILTKSYINSKNPFAKQARDLEAQILREMKDPSNDQIVQEFITMDCFEIWGEGSAAPGHHRADTKYSENITTDMTAMIQNPTHYEANIQDQFRMNLLQRTSREDAIEKVNLLQYLCFHGLALKIIDFVLKGKRRIPNPIDKKTIIDYKDCQSEKLGNTALHFACINLKKDCIEKLLLARVHVDIQNISDHETPLHVLVQIYDQLKQQRIEAAYEDQFNDLLDQTKDMIQLLLPHCDGSLLMQNKMGQNPYQTSKSKTIRQALSEYYDEEPYSQSHSSIMPRVYLDGRIADEKKSSSDDNIEDDLGEMDEFRRKSNFKDRHQMESYNAGKFTKSKIDESTQRYQESMGPRETGMNQSIQQANQSSMYRNEQQERLDTLLYTEQRSTTRQMEAHPDDPSGQRGGYDNSQHLQSQQSVSKNQMRDFQRDQQNGCRSESKITNIQIQKTEKTCKDRARATGLAEYKNDDNKSSSDNIVSSNCLTLKRSQEIKATELTIDLQNRGAPGTELKIMREYTPSKYDPQSSLKENIHRQLSEKSPIATPNKGSFQVGSSFLAQNQTYAKEYQIGPEDFKAHQLLGTGSFGEVFLVEEIATKELYAMKVLSKEKTYAQSLLKYAFAERAIMREMTLINHPYIVKIKYAFQTTESLYMILQFCSGGDLSQYLELEGYFPEEKAKAYIAEVICAIEALHSKNIIFRDLKPDNIVLDSEGHALLTDFGLSRRSVADPFKGADSFCGSYAYLAPEMIRKKGHGKAVDWYLIGVVLYELLTGLPPHYDDDKETLFKNIKHNKLTFPSNDKIPLTSPCKDLLAKLLEKDPNKRLGKYKGIQDIKSHAFFKNVDWQLIESRELAPDGSETPARKHKAPAKAYLHDMAMSIIEKQPYVLIDHPKTKGKAQTKGDPGYIEGWELDLTRNVF